MTAITLWGDWICGEQHDERVGEDGNHRVRVARGHIAVSRPAGFVEAIRDWELFDADEGKDLAVKIREYYIPDFGSWKNHDSYQKEFEKLPRDLRTKESKGARE